MLSMDVTEVRSPAPEADAALIARARGVLGEGVALSGLFVRPSAQAKNFLAGLTRRERIALENTARTTP